MSISKTLPSCLHVKGDASGISVERALKLIVKVLEAPDECTDEEISIAIEDAKTLLRGVE